MRLAIEARYVEFILKDNVAVVVKKPIFVDTGCGARHRVRYTSPFVLRGGVKLFEVDEVVEADGEVYHARAMRKLRYGAVILADRYGQVQYTNVDERGNILPHIIKRYVWSELQKPRLVATGYFVFDVNNEAKEAKLVDEDPTHLLYIYEHKVNSRTHGAMIKLYPSSLITFREGTSCATQSTMILVAIVPVNTRFVVCANRPPYRREFEEYYECYEVEATIPLKQQYLSRTPIPDTMYTSAVNLEDVL
jgi:hypothetical protein